jgi:phenylalanyl-tRNA synthetase beta chain
VEFPRFPAIRRDLAVVVSENIPWRKIEDCIKRSAGVSLEEIRFFDLYKGKQIPQGKKSIAFSMSFRAKDRTLSNEEIDIAIKNIIDALEREIGGDVRKK